MASAPDHPTKCARCTHELTQEQHAIEVAGAHVHHDLVNPAGYRFTIACFAKAPGCVTAGESSDHSVWFSGCTWQRAFCRGCTWHVGWLFRSRSHVFFGLDTARVVSASTNEPGTE